jgi:hypothetical protein
MLYLDVTDRNNEVCSFYLVGGKAMGGLMP